MNFNWIVFQVSHSFRSGSNTLEQMLLHELIVSMCLNLNQKSLQCEASQSNESKCLKNEQETNNRKLNME